MNTETLILIVALFCGLVSCATRPRRIFDGVTGNSLQNVMVYGMKYSVFSPPKGAMDFTDKEGFFEFQGTCIAGNIPTSIWIAKEGYYPIVELGWSQNSIALYPLPKGFKVSEKDLEEARNKYTNKLTHLSKEFGFFEYNGDLSVPADCFPEVNISHGKCNISNEARVRWWKFTRDFNRRTSH